MKKYTLIISLLFILLVLLINGCINRPDSQKKIQENYLGLTDNQGNIVKLVQKPKRIVSLTLRSDEILLDLVPPERILALSRLADDEGISNIVDKAKLVSRRATLSAEQIVEMQPDLVLAAQSQPIELIQILRDARIPVYIHKIPRSVTDVQQVIAEMAAVVDEEENGAHVIDKMNDVLAAIAKKVEKIPLNERKTVVRFTVMGGGGGKGSSFDDVCHYAGVRNGAALAGVTANQQLSKEQIIKINPDLFLLPTWDYYGKTDMRQYKAEILADPALKNVKAIKEQRLIEVPDRYMLCTSQYMVYGIRDIFDAAYPDLKER